MGGVHVIGRIREPEAFPWWLGTHNVVELAYWLDDRDEFRSSTDVIRLFEKPQTYQAEHRAMLAEKRSEVTA